MPVARRLSACVLAWALAGGYVMPVQAMSLASGQQQVSLSVDIDPAGRELQGLMVEWDGLDVTGYAALAGADLSINLPVAPAPGDHQLVVMAFYTNGDIDVVAEHTVTAEAPPGLASTRWSGVATVDARWRAGGKDDNDFDGIDASRQVVSVKTGSTTQAGNWQVETLVGATHDTDVTGISNGEHAELANFEVRATLNQQRWRHQLAAGDLHLGSEGLMFNQFQRRGLEAGTQLDQRVGLSAFAVNSTQSTRIDGDLVWPDDPGEEIQGLVFNLTPFSGERQDWLGLQLGWLDGETPYSGLGQAPDGVLYGGSSWSVQWQSRLLADVLSINGEYAESDFDADGLEAGESEVNDDALQWQVTLSPAAVLPRFGLDQWSLGFGETDVGTHFYSLANLYLAGDLLTRSQTLTLGKGGFLLNLENQSQENNRDDDPGLPTQEGSRRGATFNYSPMWIDASAGAWQVLGQPSLSGYFYDSTLEQDDFYAKVVQFDVDSRTTEKQLALQLSGSQRSITLSHTRIDFIDDSMVVKDTTDTYIVYQPQGDTDTQVNALMLSWYPTVNWTFTPSIQRNRFHTAANGAIFRSTSWGLDLNGQLVPGKLFLQLNYNSAKDRAETDDLLSKSSTDSQNSQYLLTWRWRQASGVRPAVDFYSQGQHGVYEDHVYLNGDETWQVNLGVKLNWEKPL